MVEQQRPRRPRPPRQGPPGGGRPSPEAATEGAGAQAPTAPREIAPWNYRAHLEEEHGAKVIAEEGWPTEYKRYKLVKVDDGKEKTISLFTGMLPEALQHFYRYLHPEPRVRRRRG